MNDYVIQYKVLFFITWIVMYLVFPSWRFPNNHGDQFAINVFIVYFTIAAYLVDRYFNFLVIDKPVFIKINNWVKNVIDNLWLVIICLVSLLLHVYLSYFTSVIAMGEVMFLRETFWIYDFLNTHWHKLFHFSIQYFIWSLTALIIVFIKQKKAINYVSRFINTNSPICKSSKLIWPFTIFIMFGIFNIYSYLFPYYSWQEAGDVLRYPPVSRVIYLIVYSAFGISAIGPRIVQFIFYISGAVYLYRTIHLFSKKEAALLGATIYLFSPLLFSHATFASTGSGVAFFIILISYYFLRFIKEEDNRDLLLCTYFIGLGFLYKEEILVMFIICFAYLFFSRIRNRNLSSILHFKILLLALIPVLPWLNIGPGNYETVWHNLISYDGLTKYSQMLQNQLSLIVFALFIIAFLFVLFTKKDDLSLYFLFFFVTYYFFFTLKGAVVHRYSVALYPAIHVLLSQFVFSITQRLKWKYSFGLVYSVLVIYLITICVVPRSVSGLVTYNYNDFEYQRQPIDKALDWIRERTNEKENILALYFVSDMRMYIDRIYEHRDEINNRVIFHVFEAREAIASSEDLKRYCLANNIYYVMFPYSPEYATQNLKYIREREEMKNRLKTDMSNDFVEVAKFSLDDNYILVYKLKGDSAASKE